MISLNRNPTVYRHMEAAWGLGAYVLGVQHVYVAGVHTYMFLGPTRVCSWGPLVYVPGEYTCMFLGSTCACSWGPHVYVPGVHTCMLLGFIRVCSWSPHVYVPGEHTFGCLTCFTWDEYFGFVDSKHVSRIILSALVSRYNENH